MLMRHGPSVLPPLLLGAQASTVAVSASSQLLAQLLTLTSTPHSWKAINSLFAATCTYLTSSSSLSNTPTATNSQTQTPSQAPTQTAVSGAHNTTPSTNKHHHDRQGSHAPTKTHKAKTNRTPQQRQPVNSPPGAHQHPPTQRKPPSSPGTPLPPAAMSHSRGPNQHQHQRPAATSRPPQPAPPRPVHDTHQSANNLRTRTQPTSTPSPTAAPQPAPQQAPHTNTSYTPQHNSWWKPNHHSAQPGLQASSHQHSPPRNRPSLFPPSQPHRPQDGAHPTFHPPSTPPPLLKPAWLAPTTPPTSVHTKPPPSTPTSTSTRTPRTHSSPNSPRATQAASEPHQQLVDVTTAHTSKSHSTKDTLLSPTAAMTLMAVLQVYVRAGFKHTQLVAQITRHMTTRVLVGLTPMQVSGLVKTIMALEALDQALTFHLLRWLALQHHTFSTHPCEMATIVWAISHVLPIHATVPSTTLSFTIQHINTTLKQHEMPFNSRHTYGIQIWAQHTATWLEGLLGSATHNALGPDAPQPVDAPGPDAGSGAGKWSTGQQMRLFHSAAAAVQFLHGSSQDLVKLDVFELAYPLSGVVEMTQRLCLTHPDLIHHSLVQRLQPYWNLATPLIIKRRPQRGDVTPQLFGDLHQAETEH